MKIFAFHLLNDYSGSPKVLMQLIKGWEAEGADITIVTCSGREGFLSRLKGVKYNYYWYRWAANPLLRLFNLTLSQILLVAKLLFVVRKNDLIYINTVLPFGAAILGRLKGCRVVYHIHETTMKPPLLKWFLFGMVKWAADDVIYVSHFLAQQEPMPGKNIHVLHNAIETDFLNRAKANRIHKTKQGKNVLMVCSLKAYKGVNEYAALATSHPAYSFTLVVNAAQHEIDSFFEQTALPSNLKIYPTQTNLHTFYEQADVVLNLSRPDTWVETFGLTIIEAMAYGLPCIVPPVGGITELVDDGVNGFRVDCRDAEKLSHRLTEILENEDTYRFMQEFALKKIETFEEKRFEEKSMAIINVNMEQIISAEPSY